MSSCFLLKHVNVGRGACTVLAQEQSSGESIRVIDTDTGEKCPDRRIHNSSLLNALLICSITEPLDIVASINIGYYELN